MSGACREHIDEIGALRKDENFLYGSKVEDHRGSIMAKIKKILERQGVNGDKVH